MSIFQLAYFQLVYFRKRGNIKFILYSTIMVYTITWFWKPVGHEKCQGHRKSMHQRFLCQEMVQNPLTAPILGSNKERLWHHGCSSTCRGFSVLRVACLSYYQGGGNSIILACEFSNSSPPKKYFRTDQWVIITILVSVRRCNHSLSCSMRVSKTSCGSPGTAYHWPSPWGLHSW